ncbi:selenocysteine insertion sequence-binding protein 2-like [Artemia franciscana]|uniref:selenocysteine insertion sequence-binding protein 2-like n=1 Tax=Artemia franciscana TaxID=6661 RepID=UPI0032DAB8CB
MNVIPLTTKSDADIEIVYEKRVAYESEGNGRIAWKKNGDQRVIENKESTKSVCKDFLSAKCNHGKRCNQNQISITGLYELSKPEGKILVTRINPGKGKIEKSQREIQCSTKNWQDQRTKSSKTEISKKIKENLKRTDNEILNEENKTKKLTVKSLEDSLQFNDENVVNTKKSKEEQDIIREKRRRRRHIIRARKREQKEAELLQQLRAPKNSKLTILSGNALNKFLKPSKLNTKPKLEYSAFTEDFPDLNAVNTVSAPEALEKLKVPVTPMVETLTPVQTSIENRKENGIVKEIEQAEKNVSEKKAPKFSDPKQLNLFDITLAKSVLKQKTKEKRSKLRTTKRTTDFDKIIANSLDSKAPTLSRGKIITRRKKPTLMKKVILKQRQERQKLLPVSIGMVAASPRNLSNEAIDGEWLDQPEATENEGKIVVVKKKMKKKKKVNILDSNNDEPIRHTKKFREYCDQILTDDIEIVCVDLLHDLVQFQDRAHQKNPIKAKMKKRLVFGLRETTRQVERGWVKAVVIAPNLEKCNEPGGLDEAVKSLLDQIHKKGVFCVYALDRWRLSKATKKKGKTSCLGILNYQGSNENYKKLQVFVEEARSEYERRSSKNKIMQNVGIEEANTDISKNSSNQQ